MGVLHSPIADAPPRGGKVLSFQDPHGIAWELFFRPMPHANLIAHQRAVSASA
ncbi:MAG: hypothetical protein M3513_05390 [Actinomycetota bacterium]|nr:hypothetical protein [Actinomycetota bacterium]